MSWLARAVISGSLISLLGLGCGSDSDSGSNMDSDLDTDESSASGDDAGGGSDSGDGGEGNGSDGDDQPDGGDGADSDGGAGGGQDVALRESCETFCAAQSTCLGLSDADCVASCGAQADMLEALDCAEQGRDENLCLAQLTCEELMSYATEGRRSHAQCGAQATAYFASCTPGDAQECTDLCRHYEACEAPSFDVATCEETCLLRVANLEWTAGAGCSGAFLDFSGCVADANCEDALAHLQSGTTPSSCAPAETALDEACR